MNDIFCIIFSYLTPGQLLHNVRLVDHVWDRRVFYYSRHNPSFVFTMRVPVPLLLRDRNKYDVIFQHPMLPCLKKIILEMYEVPERHFNCSDFKLLVYPAVMQRLRRLLQKMPSCLYQTYLEIVGNPSHRLFYHQLDEMVLRCRKK